MILFSTEEEETIVNELVTRVYVSFNTTNKFNKMYWQWTLPEANKNDSILVNVRMFKCIYVCVCVCALDTDRSRCLNNFIYGSALMP